MRLKLFITAIAVLSAAVFTSAHAQAEIEVHEYRLDNGLKLIVKEDHRAPVVVSMVWYKVGASYEHSGITGVSHVLEHMMFKGTERHPGGEFSAIIAAQGGQGNAFTSRDYTAYYQMLRNDRLEVSFRLESDRMANLRLPKGEFEKEIEVVKEERRLRTDDVPNAVTYEELYATAFHNGPYSHPTIGWMVDLESMDVEDTRDWYESWYAPNNAIVVVAGDVEPDKVFALASEYFGGIEPSPLPELKPRHEVPQHGARKFVIRMPAKLPYLLMGYKAPVLTTAEQAWEVYALEVLAGILDGGDSARLNSRLIRDQEIAASAGAGYGLYGLHKDLFLFDGTPAAGHTIEELEAALMKEIEILQSELVRPAELQRVKAQVVADEVYAQDSVMSQASRIGMLETIGLDWKLSTEYVDRIRAVTAVQVRAVARKYLIETRKTVAELQPLPIGTESEVGS